MQQQEILNQVPEYKEFKYEVVPIQKLVRVQIGSAFITLKNLSK